MFKHLISSISLLMLFGTVAHVTPASAAPVPAETAAGGELKIAVISDVHLMAPSLLISDGEALDNYIANDRKLLREGPQLVREALDSILAFRPQTLLISGDLTKDGETVSHLYLRDSLLAPLRESGMQIFVIPGNHDVNNPHAVEFDGAETRRVSTPTAAEFADIWSDYGYGEAIARDPESLSYVVMLNDSTRLLCMDACLYEQNSYEDNICVTNGKLKRATRRFIRTQLKDARKAGDRVIAMMHHGTVSHWKYQNLIMGEYLVDGYKKVARMLGRNGVDIVFTGHFHANDISMNTRKQRKNSLFDIETGSLLSYPAPMRFVTITYPEGCNYRVDIRSGKLSGEGLTFPSGNSFEQEMLEYADGAMRSVVDGIIPEKVSYEVKEQSCVALAKAYTTHLYGDERFSVEAEAEIKAAVKALRKESRLYAMVLNMAGKSFYNDLAPADLNVTLYF